MVAGEGAGSCLAEETDALAFGDDVGSGIDDGGGSGEGAFEVAAGVEEIGARADERGFGETVDGIGFGSQLAAEFFECGVGFGGLLVGFVEFDEDAGDFDGAEEGIFVRGDLRVAGESEEVVEAWFHERLDGGPWDGRWTGGGRTGGDGDGIDGVGGVAEPSGDGWVCGEDIAVEAFDFDERVPFVGELLIVAQEGGAGLETTDEVVAGEEVAGVVLDVAPEEVLGFVEGGGGGGGFVRAGGYEGSAETLERGTDVGHLVGVRTVEGGSGFDGVEGALPGGEGGGDGCVEVRAGAGCFCGYEVGFEFEVGGFGGDAGEVALEDGREGGIFGGGGEGEIGILEEKEPIGGRFAGALEDFGLLDEQTGSGDVGIGAGWQEGEGLLIGGVGLGP